MAPVSIITTSRCVQCNMTKKVMDEHKIPYTEIAGEDPDNAEIVKKAMALGDYSSAPIIVVGDIDEPREHWMGFQPQKIKGLLNE